MKGAEAATQGADVRVVDVSVDVVPGDVAVKSSSNDVCKTADEMEIGRFIENEPILRGEPFSGENSLHDPRHARVAGGGESLLAGGGFEMKHAHLNHSVDSLGPSGLFFRPSIGVWCLEKNPFVVGTPGFPDGLRPWERRPVTAGMNIIILIPGSVTPVFCRFILRIQMFSPPLHREGSHDRTDES